MRRWLIRIISTCLSILAIIFIIGIIVVPDSADVIHKRINNQGIVNQEILAYSEDSLAIRALAFGDSSKQVLLLIHGSPGRWSDWENIITDSTIISNYFVIAVDRPGYGYTSIPAKPDLSSQSRALWQLIEKLKISDITVVGHSYGGAVAEQLVIDHEEYFNLLVLVAAAVSPWHTQPKWYNRLADTWLLQHVLPDFLLSSNVEMTGLQGSLEELEPRLATMTTPVIYLQGTDDILVPFETVEYYKKVKTAGVQYELLDSKNHFIPWTDPELIINVLKENMQNEH